MLNFQGQGWLQLGELTLAFVLTGPLSAKSAQKSAGLRTHTLVGVSAALFMLISKYGFMNILTYGQVVLDPSRVAAQVVSGIGFIGAGVIFMRRDVVRGLTTAASIWLTAALGMACGAGLPILALATTVGHFVIMLVFPILADRLPRSRKLATELHISYEDGRGLLRTILIRCTELRFAIDRVRLDHGDRPMENLEAEIDIVDRESAALPVAKNNTVNLAMLVKGKRPISHLIARLSDIDGILEVGRASDEGDWD